MLLLASTILLLAVVFLPGLLFVRAPERRKNRIVDLLATAGSCGSALWAVGIWHLPPGTLTAATGATLLLSVIAVPLLYRHARTHARHEDRDPTESRAGLLLAAGLTTCLVLRILLVAVRPPPSTGDLTMHAYMTELIALHDGMPPSHEPLLPISTFGQNSPGLHTIAAIVTRTTGLPSYETALLVGAFALFLLGLNLYRVLTTLWPDAPKNVALLAALTTPFLARNPQLYVPWGGVPTLLSDALVFYVLAEVVALVDRWQGTRAARLGLVSAGAVLTHMLPVLAFLWVLPGVVFVRLRKTGFRKVLPGLPCNALTTLVVAGPLVWPFAQRTSLRPDPAVVIWARDWISGELAKADFLNAPLLEWMAPQPPWSSLLTLPGYWVLFLGGVPCLLIAIWALSILTRSRRDLVLPAQYSLCVLVTLALLHAASLLEFLPYWQGLYPSRIHVFLLLPLGFSLTFLMRWFARSRVRIALGATGLVALLALESGVVSAWTDPRGAQALPPAIRTYTDRINARVRPDDLRAFEWLRSNTPARAVVANNAADGGQLIPAAAHRRILFPHYQFFWYRDEMVAWQRRTRPDYVFVGAAPSPAYEVAYRAEELDRDPRMTLVFRSGNARVYRVSRTPSTDATPLPSGAARPAPSAKERSPH